MVVDEAHRVSGDAGKPWAVVHDQQQFPAVRRLYMTATARIWEVEGEAPRLVASMDEDSPSSGRWPTSCGCRRRSGWGWWRRIRCCAWTFATPSCTRRSQARTPVPRPYAARGLPPFRQGLMRAAVEERFRRVLSFHSRIGEAEAMAAGVPTVVARLAEDAPDTFPPAERIWANWPSLGRSHVRQQGLCPPPGTFPGPVTPHTSDLLAVPRRRFVDSSSIGRAYFRPSRQSTKRFIRSLCPQFPVAQRRDHSRRRQLPGVAGARLNGSGGPKGGGVVAPAQRGQSRRSSRARRSDRGQHEHAK